MGFRAHIPSFGGSFVGREHDLARLREQVAGGKRLITLVGPAGVGKTRLAAHFASESPTLGRTSLEPLFCDVSTARSLDELAASVAWVLSIPTGGASGPDELVARVHRSLELRPPTVLILDNFEQLPTEAHDVVARWHGASDRVVLLVTSRHSLGLERESVLHVESLAVPANGASGRAAMTDAMQLFIDRAPPADGVTLDVALVGEVVRALDGFPLAIELAAARLEVIALSELHQRLHRRMELLRDPSSSDGDRHGSVWASIDWSWQLLTETERHCFMQTAVFVSGFSREAGEALLRLPNQRPAFDALEMLCRRHLVHTDGTRYLLYATIRDYASQRLSESGFASEIEARHADFFIERAVRCARAFDTRDDTAAFAFLEQEHANIIAAVERTLSVTPRTEHAALRALRGAEAASPVLTLRGSRSAHIELLDRALAYAETIPNARDSSAFGRVLLIRGHALRNSDQTQSARANLRDALALGKRHAAPELESSAARSLGILTNFAGQLDEALALHERGLEVARANHCRTAEALQHYNLALVVARRGRPQEGLARCAQALSILRQIGHRRHEALVLTNMSSLLLTQNRFPDAREALIQALDANRRSGDRLQGAIALGLLGDVAHIEGHLADARRCYEQAIVTFREIVDHRFEAVGLACLATIALQEDKLDEARMHLVAALVRVEQVVDTRYEGITRAMLAAERTLRADFAAAEEQRNAASTALTQVKSRAAPTLLGLSMGLRDVVAARDAVLHSDDETANAALSRARAVLETMEAMWMDHAAWARAILAAHIRLTERWMAAWNVSSAGLWFQAPGGAAVSLARRAPLARIVGALIEAHRRDARVETTSEDLVKVAWPGTKLAASTARNRLNVAISTLRKLGMSAILLRGKRGYLFDPNAPIREEAGSPRSKGTRS